MLNFYYPVYNKLGIMFFHSYTTNSNFGSFDNSFYSGFLIRTPSPGNMAKYFIIAELAARSVHSVAPLLYKIVVTHAAKKFWTYDRTRCYFQHARPTVLWACQRHSFSLVQRTFEQTQHFYEFVVPIKPKKFLASIFSF